MDYIRSSAVDVGVGLQNHCTLDEYIQNNLMIPIAVFLNERKTLSQAIESAIEYLQDKGAGSVEIPANASNRPVIIRAMTNKEHKVVINYITYNYRFPINTETRPYNGGDWQVGDLVYNTDIQDIHCLGWSCTESGTPGSWGVIGHVRRWATEAEEVSYLPQPGPMQHRRVVSYNDRLYVCKLVGGEYNWYWLDYAYGTTAERPTTDLRIGLPYFNTETDQPEWYTGRGWSGLFSSSMIEIVADTAFNILEDEFYKVFGIEKPGNDALSYADIYAAITSKWNGESSADESAMTAAQVQEAVDTPYKGESSPDPTAITSQQVQAATNQS